MIQNGTSCETRVLKAFSISFGSSKKQDLYKYKSFYVCQCNFFCCNKLEWNHLNNYRKRKLRWDFVKNQFKLDSTKPVILVSCQNVHDILVLSSITNVSAQ